MTLTDRYNLEQRIKTIKPYYQLDRFTDQQLLAVYRRLVDQEAVKCAH